MQAATGKAAYTFTPTISLILWHVVFGIRVAQLLHILMHATLDFSESIVELDCIFRLYLCNLLRLFSLCNYNP
jgi:hypothetical protein